MTHHIMTVALYVDLLMVFWDSFNFPDITLHIREIIIHKVCNHYC